MARASLADWAPERGTPANNQGFQYATHITHLYILQMVWYVASLASSLSYDILAYST